MADSPVQWVANQDGFLSLGESALSVIYHPSLNIILVVTKESEVIVLDVSSGCKLQKSDLSGCKSEPINCVYLSGRDKLFVSDQSAVGVRKDLNGVLLLDTVLQTPVRKGDETIKLEFPMQDACHLFKGLMSNDLPGVEQIEDVIRELEKQIIDIQQITKGNHKLAKWATISLQMSHSTMKNMFSILMMELNNMPLHTPDLPVAAALYDRLTYLLPGTRPDLADNGTAPVDRTLMYSEAARAETFSKWPHMSYKWALPEPMAQAGFYHQPNGTGDDRAMCFTCSVCLVCWEPTDEPWSEHERHSPICPFVKGEYTQNVPLALTYATEPAMLHGKKSDKIECVSSTSCDDFIATSTLNGNVVIWDVTKQLKKHLVFDIDPYDPVIAVKTGTPLAVYDDTAIKRPPKSAWLSDEPGCSTVEEGAVNNGDYPVAEVFPMEVDTTTKFKRSRPCRDVQVTSLCVAGSSHAQSSVAGYQCKPALISGVSIRRSVSSEENQEVQMMNKVNEALSTKMDIYGSSDSVTMVEDCEAPSAPFVPYLVVHNITPASLNKDRTETSGSASSTTGSVPLTDIIQMVELDYDSESEMNPVSMYNPAEKSEPTVGLSASKDKFSSMGKIRNECNNKSLNGSNSNSTISENVAIQCIELPDACSKEEFIISNITTTLDNKHIIVTLAPRDVQVVSDSTFSCDIASTSDVAASTSSNGETGINGDTASSSNDTKVNGESNHKTDSELGGGYLLIYRLNFESEVVQLCPDPVRTYLISSQEDAISSLLLLPLDILALDDDDISNDSDNSSGNEILGMVAVMTCSGKVKVHKLDSFRSIVEIDHTAQNEYFSSATFCTGLDRLCLCTRSGSLYFYQLAKQGSDGTSPASNDSPVHMNLKPNVASDSLLESIQDDMAISNSLLVKQPLTIENLTSLHELTLFENLLPRFSATLPQCWTEIQQEQQQRRHPQHLQQQGEATQHTRTWRLQTDNNSYDEHLIELVLPKPTCVGHIDVRFTLHPLVMSPSKIQVTLLKQNISNIGHRQNDTPFRFLKETMKSPIQPEPSTSEPKTQNKPNGKKKTCKENPVLNPEFLEKHNAEILCGPVEFNNYLDLSGNGGLVTLTSSALMKVKTKSFLIHVKALLTDDDLKMKTTVQPETLVKEKTKTQTDKPKKKISLFDQVHLGGQTSGGTSVPSTLTKVCPDTLKGCDCITEISITIRKSKKTSVPKDRLQRAMMIAQTSFHEQLILAIFDTDDKVCMEQKRSLVLDTLCWIASIQIHEPKPIYDETCLVDNLGPHLKNLVKCCFLDGGRTIAHKCARLLAICMEYCKNSKNANLAASFNTSILQALLASLQSIGTAQSAGALHWFFAMLDRVKCMDVSLVGTQCVELLTEISKQYNTKMSPIYSLLKARYSLYGTPCDPELFDMEPPTAMKVTPLPNTTSQSYASIVATNNNNGPGSNNNNLGTNNNNTSTSPLSNEDTDFQDLLQLNADKTKNNGNSFEPLNKMFGLLEVEPLHFTCHATSDGTRMERMDTGVPSIFSSTHTSAQGSMNFGEGLVAYAPQGTGVALASLSSAMASAEQQLQLLQNKQHQLLKLQAQKAKLEQKLAESSQGPAQQLQFSYGSSSELFPPTPKTTPLFMTPPMTPPNEGYSTADIDPLGVKSTGIKFIKTGLGSKQEKPQSVSVPLPPISQAQTILQPPPPHVLVVERMHSGARRFVVLDFGKPILLTDILIPTCTDLASLSIDVWEQGEETDGRRLIVASDIGIRPLIMNDLTPPPVCRYLKMTTIGRYGASTSRSRIPIGSFYGHTFILPWEKDQGMLGAQGTENETSPVNNLSSVTRTAIVSHLNMLLSLQEDILCRYSLARHRLESLLHTLDQSIPQSVYRNGNSTNGKQQNDQKVIQSYNDCIQLQLQLNLAQRAIVRLQKYIGVSRIVSDDLEHCQALQQASIDKLRVLSEFILKVLLGITGSSTAIPHLPGSLFAIFDSSVCIQLFQNLCIHGTKQMQLMAGVLLVRMCGRQSWWGNFLGNSLSYLFSSNQVRIIPLERVFVLLTTLGQKSMMSSNASSVLECLLGLLAKLLSPLWSNTLGQNQQSASIDIPLISRLLVFLTKTLDLRLSANNDENDKKHGSGRDNSPINNHWDFLLGESLVQSNKSNSKSSTKMYRRKLHKRLMHHKQQLLDLQQAKKIFFNTQKEKLTGTLSKETETIIKQQEHLFKKQLKQYTSKHFKDLMHIRRTDAEMLRKNPRDPNGSSSSNGEKDQVDDNDSVIVLPRERCILVAKGLVALLLSMDFTCNTDLFLISCKVLARIVSTTRPAITLSETMTQDQLEQFILLCSSIEHNHAGSSWGGPWAVHAITCLLLDILESERLYPVVPVDGITDDEMTASLSETDDSNGQGNNSDREGSNVETSSNIENNVTVDNDTQSDESKAFDKDTLWNMLLDASQDKYPPPSVVQLPSGVIVQTPTSTATKALSGTGSVSMNIPLSKAEKLKVNQLKKSIADFSMMYRCAGTTFQGTSIAMDSRLEFGIEQCAELRLKMMVSMETDNLQNALLSPLPTIPKTKDTPSAEPSTAVTDDEQLSEAGLIQANNRLSQEVIPSCDMLGTCFNHLVLQLPMNRVDIDTILSLWLTMNDDGNSEEINFDSSKIPVIPLTPVAISTLLNKLTVIPNITVRTWTLVFQTLTWLTNMRTGEASTDRSMASIIMADTCLVPVLIKFLSGSTPSGQGFKVGPTTTQVFQSFLLRLSARCSAENKTHLLELLLKLVFTLTTERGPLRCGAGPLDAQYKLIEHVLELDFENVDISNAISVISSISMFTKQYFLSQERVSCLSSSENNVNPTSCFGGLFASLLCPGDNRSMQGEATPDGLVCSLLKLVNSLVQIPLPRPRTPQTQSESESSTNVTDVTMTDLSKINLSLVTDGASASGLIDREPETDEQKSENAAQTSKRSCSHFVDVDRPDDTKEPCIADIILAHGNAMVDLIYSLNRCSSNTMASLMGTSSLGCSAQQACLELDPISVGDCIFQILSTLNRKATDVKLIIQPLFDYLTNQNGMMQTGCHLSEPFLWILVGVLDCKPALETFIEMGGIEVICRNMVWSSKHLINSAPSFISEIMPFMCSTRPKATAKTSSTDDTVEGLTNFAPQSSISSSNPSAGPADVLIQPFLPHRRARSPAWSYHFYPDEAWVDLHVQLSCAVLLKEVHIRPHLTSLATCPSSVSLEISRDGISFIPISAPLVTSGLMVIKLQLERPEIASIVTLRLHKPKDSNTLGLSQIMLLGTTAFGDSGSKAKTLSASGNNSSDDVSKTSMCWLRLLHHCLFQLPDMSNAVSERAAPVPSLLNTCSAMLTSSTETAFSTHLETVLLRLGLHSTETGLALIDNLLRNQSNEYVSGNVLLPLYGKMNGSSNGATIEILHQLGLTQDDGTSTRIHALMEWLGDCARKALQHNMSFSRNDMSQSMFDGFPDMDEGLPNPSSSHIHCVAAILWQSQELPVRYDLQSLITQELFSSIYEWSTVLHNATLKKAVDCVIASMCHIRPYYLLLLLEWMGIFSPNQLDNCNADQLESMTDDSKEASSQRGEVPSGLTNIDCSNIIVTNGHLTTLALACQSEAAAHQLLNSGFPELLCQSILEFCTQQLGFMSESIADASTDAAKTDSYKGKSRSASSVASMCSETGLCVTADLVPGVMNFLADVASEPVMKDWLVSESANIFWPVLTTMLCTNPLQSSTCLALNHSQKLLSGQQRAAVETATVYFFCSVTAGHSVAQHLFAQVLCDVIKEQGIGQPGTTIVLNNLPLSGFTRRLFLQVLLEDEKIQVAIKSNTALHDNQSGVSRLHHPKFGAGHKHKVLTVPLQTECSEILSMLTDGSSLGVKSTDSQDDEKEDNKKDASELGIEVVDQLSTATGIVQSTGMSAKEKRDLYKHGGSLPTLPRPPTRRGRPREDFFGPTTSFSVCHPLIPGQSFPPNFTVSQIMVLLQKNGLPQGISSIDLTMKSVKLAPSSANIHLNGAAASSSSIQVDEQSNGTSLFGETPSFTSALQVFASVGGLALLAEHLPLLYPEITRQVGPADNSRDMNLLGMKDDWVTVEYEADIFELDIEPSTPATSSQSNRQSSSSLPNIPPHSLVAFGLFLRLPGYAEVLLMERKKAQCLLRLVLGVTDDGDGGHILTSPVASSLPTLPFSVLKSLFDQSPLSTDDGVLLRRMALDIGAVHLIMACLSVLSHHAPRVSSPGFHHEIITAAMQVSQPQAPVIEKTTDDKSQHYWAKGTGFGTGSFTSSWDAEQALLRQKSEEEHVTCLLQVLASYINPGAHIPESFEKEGSASDGHTEKHCLPTVLPELLQQSCLVPAISSYLRNDSVLDMARHVPLYKALLELLRGIAICPVLVPLLLPSEKDDGSMESACLSSLLSKMKSCVDTYASRLKTKKGGIQTKEEDDESEGLALLIPDIQNSATLVEAATRKLREEALGISQTDTGGHSKSATLINKSLDDHYMATMKELQFDTFEIIEEDENVYRFKCPHHYESNIKAAGEVVNAARARRLAQEAVTLSTSLPLSASSSVFVRCDEERLDVMKVLITGPAETPYANGCFILDVFFPQDYPNSPPLVNLETTGNHTVRFNPNLYNDGKVCLSILNTWHGRPEEKWNSQTSSFLQVLVSVQSLILVSEPYFNEPGYERSRGTLSGAASSREYDANIRQATVKWAMLEQIRNPDPSFKDIIMKHFWMKRNEVMRQCEEWISDLEMHTGDKRFGRTINHSCLALKRHYHQLKEEFMKMKAPSDLEDFDMDFDDVPLSSSSGNNGASSSDINSARHSLNLAPSVIVSNSSEKLAAMLQQTKPIHNHTGELHSEEDELSHMGNWTELPPPPLPPPISGQSLDASNDDSPTSSELSDSSTATPKMPVAASHSFLMNSTVPVDTSVPNDIGYDEVDFC